MRVVGLFFLVLMITLAPRGAARAESTGICASEGEVRFLCGPRQPEDLFSIHGAGWIVTSSMSEEGGVHLVNARTKVSLLLYPSPVAAEQFDKVKYRGCPGPPSVAEKARFTTLGLTVRPGRNEVHDLYVIRFPQATVHAFKLDLRKPTPSVTWVGCVEPPEKALLNALVALPEGGFIASKFWERGEGMTAGRAAATAGEITGELWEWRPRRGWSKVPGSEGSGPNGVEISKDGKWLYVSEWGKHSMYRLYRGPGAPRREAVQLRFRPDNIHWSPDGALLVAGNFEGRNIVARVDPETLKVTELIVRPDSGQFEKGTVAVQVGDEIWVGSSRGHHIAIYPELPPR